MTTQNREKYSCYEFEINCEQVPAWSKEGKTDKTVNGFTYKIYYWHDYYNCEDTIDSDEWFDTEQEARFAVIGHISKLENGEC